MTRSVCSFTGHRQIPDSEVENLTQLLKRAIAFAYDKGCRDFCTGGAIGFDTMAGREVVLFRLSHPDVRLILVLPCTDQDGKWDARQRDAYQYLLSVADEVKYLSDSYTPDCMKRRNQYLADVSDMMISYVTHEKTGSSQTVRMAKAEGKPVYNLALESKNPQ